VDIKSYKDLDRLEKWTGRREVILTTPVTLCLPVYLKGFGSTAGAHIETVATYRDYKKAFGRLLWLGKLVLPHADNPVNLPLFFNIVSDKDSCTLRVPDEDPEFPATFLVDYHQAFVPSVNFRTETAAYLLVTRVDLRDFVSDEHDWRVGLYLEHGVCIENPDRIRSWNASLEAFVKHFSGDKLRISDPIRAYQEKEPMPSPSITH
jgi:hypothetical protein